MGHPIAFSRPEIEKRREEMRTVIIILGGFALLAICIAASRWFAGSGATSISSAVKIFIPIWLCAAAINMWIGVARAGYSVAEEFPIFLLIFGLPTAVALLLWWKFS
jgi:hypothetical protein